MRGGGWDLRRLTASDVVGRMVSSGNICWPVGKLRPFPELVVVSHFIISSSSSALSSNNLLVEPDCFNPVARPIQVTVSVQDRNQSTFRCHCRNTQNSSKSRLILSLEE